MNRFPQRGTPWLFLLVCLWATSLASCSLLLQPEDVPADDPSTVPSVLRLHRPWAGTLFLNGEEVQFDDDVKEISSLSDTAETYEIRFELTDPATTSFEGFDVTEASATTSCQANPMTVSILKTTIEVAARVW